MSYVIAAPEYVAAAATDLANIGAALRDASVAAALPTTGAFLPAGADAVSTEMAALFGAHAEAFQALSVQAAAFHDQFVQLMNFGSQSYAVTEAANVSSVQSGLRPGLVNMPQQTSRVLSEGAHPAPAVAVAPQAMAVGSAAAAASAGPVGSAIPPVAIPVGSVGSVQRQPISPVMASPAEPAEITGTRAVSALPAPLAARAAPAAAIAGAPTARVEAGGEGAPASS